MKTFYINPKEIKIREGLGRIRKDMGDLKELAKSIDTLGQIVPVIVNDKNELIDGGRRVGACILQGVDIFCVSRDNVNDREMKALELEANIRRKSFNAVEELEGINFLHEMKLADDKDWRMEDTGKMLGMERSGVAKKLKLASVVEAFPELKKLKNESEINKAVKQIAKTAARAEAVKDFEAKEECVHDVSVKHAKDACADYKDNSIHLLLSDPPYGIDIDSTMKAMQTPAKFTYPDGFEAAVKFYWLLATEGFRFVKEDGHAFIFFAPELYQIVRDLFVEAGWKTNHRPIVWIKHPSGQTNQPTMWPSACYEMCMYFRKEKSKLILEGKPDWVQFNPVPPERKLHPSEKPVELLREFIQRVALPGDIMADPFMGSGSSLEAALLEQLVPKVSDIAKECYTMAMSRVAGMK